MMHVDARARERERERERESDDERRRRDDAAREKDMRANRACDVVSRQRWLGMETRGNEAGGGRGGGRGVWMNGRAL